jgi:hypothetical protein
MSGALIAAKVAGAALSAASVYEQGMATAAGYAQSKHGAQMAAKEVWRRRNYEQWRNAVYARKTVGTQMNTFGALGVELQGTAIDDLAETMKELTLEKVMTARNEKAEALGYEQAAKDYAKAESRAKRGAALGAAGTFLGGITSM